MPFPSNVLLALGAITGALAVAFGAFGAHALRERLAPDMMTIYHTAVQYHFWHALALVAIGLAAAHLPDATMLKWAGALMIAGIFLFSGSLYVLALTGMRALGMVTPFGGVALIAAWLAFAWAVWKG